MLAPKALKEGQVLACMQQAGDDSAGSVLCLRAQVCTAQTQYSWVKQCLRKGTVMTLSMGPRGQIGPMGA